MEKHTVSYQNGMDRDSSVNKYDNTHYYYAKNFRLITQDELSTGALENIKGLSTAFTLSTNEVSIGVGESSDIIILFVHNTATGLDKIRTFNLNTSVLTTVYSGELSFNVLNPITSIVGVYENSSIHKIYWTDGLNPLGSINIADATLSSKSLQHVYYSNIATYSIPVLSVLLGGGLKAGKVQYAYQYYNLHGATTYFSDLTKPVFLAQKLQNAVFTGSSIDTDVDKSVRITITPDYNYDRIRIVSVHTSSYYGAPTVNILGDFNIVSGANVSVVDAGVNYIGSITYEEFVVQNPLFTCEHIESFKNYLFPSGITYNAFDFDYDARAYRHSISSDSLGSFDPIYLYDDSTHRIRSSGSATVSHLTDILIGSAEMSYQLYNGTSWVTTGSVITENIPIDYNCINYYNDITKEYRTSIYPGADCAFVNGSTTFGGHGVNVKYTVSMMSMPATPDYNASPLCNQNIGLQAGETYRVGMIGLNTKNQSSPVKWIADIKIPEIHEFVGGTTDLFYISATAYNLPTEVVSWRLVIVPRTDNDRTVQMSGVLCGYMESVLTGVAGGSYYSTTPLTEDILNNNTIVHSYGSGTVGSTYDKLASNFCLYTPETSFLRRKAEAGDYIQVIGKYNAYIQVTNNTVADAIGGFATSIHESYDNNIYPLTKSTSYVGGILGTSGLTRTIIDESEIRGQEIQTTNTSNYDLLTLGNVSIYNRRFLSYIESGNQVKYETFAGINNHINAYSGGRLKTSSPALTTDQYIFDDNSKSKKKFDSLYARIKSIVSETAYGGNTYESRLSNVYIPLSDITLKNSSATSIGYGDTWFSTFEFLGGYVDINSTNNKLGNFIFKLPCASSFNLSYRLDPIAKYDQDNQISPPNLFETKLYAESIGIRYPSDLGDLYAYNTAYARNNNIISYTPVVNDSSIERNFPTRILSSSKKVYGENIDGFSIFKTLNYIDLDTRYGDISKLIIFNSQLYFFQEKAFGILSVEPRSTISDTAGNLTALGTGGVLDRYDFISVATGSSFYKSIITSDTALFWYDDINRMFYVFKGESVPLSDVKGMYSYFNSLLGVIDITSVYDKIHKEILISIKKQDNSIESLCYNQLLNCFSGFTSHEITNVVKVGSSIISTRNGNIFYLHDSGNRGLFYGSEVDSELILLLNPIPNNISRFNIFEWLSESEDNATNDTFTSLRVYNDYQNSGTISLIANSDLVRRMRTWKFNSFRDNSTDNPRFKNPYIKAHFKYINDGTKFVSHDISVLYDTVNKKK